MLVTITQSIYIANDNLRSWSWHSLSDRVFDIAVRIETNRRIELLVLNLDYVNIYQLFHEFSSLSKENQLAMKKPMNYHE